MKPAEIMRPAAQNRAELRELGRSLRETVPIEAQAEFVPAPGRDPIAILERQAETRVPTLVPVRHGRMARSEFTFYRGAAAVMAADLAPTPATGVHVQACGDAHLLNFGLFATPERNLVFDVNDFDETLPAPWEWDLKRLVASVVVAGRSVGATAPQCGDLAIGAVRSYAVNSRQLAGLSTLDVWYSATRADDVFATLEDDRQIARVSRVINRARHHTNLRALDKLTTVKDGRRVIVDDPPRVEHTNLDPTAVLAFFADYRSSLPSDRAHLFDQFEFVDGATKTVGVGSVGTRCFVVVGAGRADLDPLILQIKEAEASVLEPFVGPSTHAHHGQRVVQGQRLMQAASDPFLGWSTGEHGHTFYIRQLWDMKASVDTNGMGYEELVSYAGSCGATLARAHARSLDPAVVSGYCGGGAKLAKAMGRFAERYADQNALDHAEFAQAVADGRVDATPDV